jgi:hypothetical protein
MVLHDFLTRAYNPYLPLRWYAPSFLMFHSVVGSKIIATIHLIASMFISYERSNPVHVDLVCVEPPCTSLAIAHVYRVIN